MIPFTVLRRAALTLALAALAGCSAISSLDSAATPLDTYELRPLAAGTVRASGGGGILEVELPTATGALTSDRIVIKPTPLEVQSLPGARWVNDATDHVQLLLVRSLANSGRFSLVSGAGSGPSPDYVLLSDLQAFQFELEGEAGAVVIRTSLSLLREEDGRVISSRSFTSTAPVGDLDTASILAGFDTAMTAQLGEIVTWIVARARG